MSRMFEEMAIAGLPEPVLQQTDAGFKLTLFNSSEAERTQIQTIIGMVPLSFGPALDRLFNEGRLSTSEAAASAGVSLPTARRYLQALEAAGLLHRVARSSQDPNAYWTPPRPLRGRWRASAWLGAERTQKLN